jgi:N-acyl-D-amino-acid deacylase
VGSGSLFNHRNFRLRQKSCCILRGHSTTWGTGLQHLRYVVIALCLVVNASSLLIAQPHKAKQQSAPAYDLVVRGGRVIDGAGNPWVYADVAIRGDRIVKIGRNITGVARREITANGLVVAPGFIDMHTHSDLTLLVDGDAQSKIRQGVTTEILGEAASVAPVCPASRQESAAGDADLHIKRDWQDFQGYYRRLIRQGTSVNVGSYVAGGTIRACGMGFEMRAPSGPELEAMKRLVAQAMRQGALGLATGMIYPPNSYAQTDELIELAKVAAQYGGIYTTHMRSEGAGLVQAVQENIAIAEGAHIPIHILHLKSAGSKNWGRIKDAVQLIAEARARGLEISADQYPYVASSTGLSTQLPQWAQDGGTQRMVERLNDLAERNRIRAAVVSGMSDPNKMILASARSEANHKFEGHTIAEISEMRHEEPVDTVLNLLSEEKGRVGMVYFTMAEDDLRYAMQQPWVSIGSDGSAMQPEGLLGRDKPHPRSYGTHARVLGHYVREEHVLTLEDAVRKMTSLAAGQLGVHNRGLLAEGYKADLVVFDQNEIGDTATFASPQQFAVGMKYVLVNGKLVIEQGKHTGAKPGQIIYGPGYKKPTTR